MRGGQKPRTTDGPVLQIYVNRKVTARALKPGDPQVSIQLSKEELDTLLKELIDDTNILEITTASIEAELRKQNSRLHQFPDAPTTFLSIQLQQGSTLISIKGVSALAYLVPDASSLQTLFSIQRRLLNLSEQVNTERK